MSSGAPPVQVGVYNRESLAAGVTNIPPAGNYMVELGAYTALQVKDPITGAWTSIGTAGRTLRSVYFDGVNTRIANLSGCAVGAFITNVGSGYTNSTLSSSGALTNTNPVVVTPSAGASTWTAIVGGAISTSITVVSGGAYTYAPTAVISAPPPGGVQATATVTISAGAVSALTVVNQGAGYQSAPTVTFIRDPRDTGTTAASATTALTGSGTITAIICTDHGTALTSVPTFTITGGGGASGAATAVMCFVATGITVTDGGTGYGNAQPFGIITTGGVVAGTAGAVVNPAIGPNILTPRQASMRGTSTAGGLITATGLVINDAGMFQSVPFALVIAGGSGLATDTGEATVTVGGTSDTYLLQPI